MTQASANQASEIHAFVPGTLDEEVEKAIRIHSRGLDAVATARAAGLKNFGVYVLIGFQDTAEDALARLEHVRSLGIRPNPMRYQPLNTPARDSYIAPGWTDFELRRITRYYSRLRWLEHIPYEDYQPSDQPLFAGLTHREDAPVLAGASEGEAR